ncbi:meiosis-specific APC/C activator protein AMA1 [[Emmonsia] crescens]|uniref:Meiosis-specific APC/C activator protein AMA1 n=1 Tax=[Emmonsia] crescens TaxID=73230 RepID=A0A2B7ZUH2_9EURO|nr:meiosis-specific APC/C activator protein AMA1 [Emmonsia crescens]
MLSRCHSVEELSSCMDTDNLSLTLFPDSPVEQTISGLDFTSYSPEAQSSHSSSPTSSQFDADSSPSPTIASITSPGSSRNITSPLSDSYFSQEKKPGGVEADPSPARSNLLHALDRSQSVIGSPSPVSRKRFPSPDRFLPAREPYATEVPAFRLSKNPRLLSPREKLLRRRDPRVDPFAPYQPRRRVGLSSSNRLSDRRDTPHHLPRHVSDTSVYARNDRSASRGNYRQISAGAVWNVGGTSAATGSAPVGVQDGHGGLISTGTNAPMYLANFLDKDTHAQHLKSHESRLAAALDIDQATKILKFGDTSLFMDPKYITEAPQHPPYVWKHSNWVRADNNTSISKSTKPARSAVPSTPFRVLDAPLLRDDFYCSTLAYSYTARMLAVGLSSRVYLWSELLGVQYPPLTPHLASNYVTSLSFSSPQGGNSILAVGRHGGQVSLWSTFDTDVRFEFYQPNSVSCVSFKQVTTKRHSARFQGLVDTEDLVVGDDTGNVWCYSIEWPDPKSRERHGWNGTTTLIAKISAHTQQICGLVWSPDGKYLATGGNDNTCLLFDLSDMLGKDDKRGQLDSSEHAADAPASSQARSGPSRFPYHPHLNRIFDWSRINQFALSQALGSEASPGVVQASTRRQARISGSRQHQTIFVPANRQKHKFQHSAAVKAIAFAPWQPSLLATGGGSNDRCIHFFHTGSGACLATINVHAQVTSLIWSKTRREIAATFGYAQPEHPFRVAVFAWPSCQQVVAIPWTPASDGGPGSTDSDNSFDCGRALWAISYPGGPNDAAHTGGDERVPSTSSSSSTVIAAPQGAITGTNANQSISPGSVNTNSTITASSPITRPRFAYREGGTWWSRTAEEGCIIVASSDECVRFHEVWSGSRKSTTGATGQLGGSPILESLEGIDREGSEVIR